VRFGETTEQTCDIRRGRADDRQDGRKTDAGAAPAGSPLEVPLVFLKLGVSCCGGPIAFAIVFTTSLTV
jgi:hypothetical protein